jgi:hypothetical protein
VRTTVRVRDRTQPYTMLARLDMKDVVAPLPHPQLLSSQ